MLPSKDFISKTLTAKNGPLPIVNKVDVCSHFQTKHIFLLVNVANVRDRLKHVAKTVYRNILPPFEILKCMEICQTTANITTL